MPYSFTKIPDGDVSLGNLNGEFVVLSDSPSDYPTGGYVIVDTETANNNNAPNTINCDLWKVITAFPAGSPSGYLAQFNPATKAIVFYRQNSSTGQFQQLPAGFDLSGLNFLFLLAGY